MRINGKRYSDFSSFIKLNFGERVQKISLNTGFSCPNRDGSKGYGGCTYCNNNSFNPAYCKPIKPINQQLEEGIRFFEKKGKNNKFLAYFQAYTNTYASVQELKKLYEEALQVPKIVGIVIGTRPDCVSDELISYLEQLSKNYFVALEFGVESTSEKTLLEINRCHTFKETVATYNRCKNKGFHLGAHLILGLPNETEQQMLQHAYNLSKLPIDTLKLHHLQIVENSVLSVKYKRNKNAIKLFTVDNYIAFAAKFITYLKPSIVIERFVSEAPKDILIAPKWGYKNFEMVAKIDTYLAVNNLWQGKNYKP